MNSTELSVAELERMAAVMAQAIPNLQCPECCDRGWTYQYMEMSAELFQEEYEWACLATVLCKNRSNK